MAVSDLVTMRVRMVTNPQLDDDVYVGSLVGTRVPLQIDGVTIREGRVVAASVVEGQLEVELADVPAIWGRLYDEGQVLLDIASHPRA